MPIVLTPQEERVITAMRAHGPYVVFHVHKRPKKDNPKGEIYRIVVEEGHSVDGEKLSPPTLA